MSPNLLRFPKYSALAYGAKGLMVFDWGGGIWNRSGDSAGSVIATVAETNTAIRAWGPTLLAHTDHHAVYHSAAIGGKDLDAPTGPESATVVACNENSADFSTTGCLRGGLVQSVSGDLMVGVMTKPVNGERTIKTSTVPRDLSANAICVAGG